MYAGLDICHLQQRLPLWTGRSWRWVIDQMQQLQNIHQYVEATFVYLGNNGLAHKSSWKGGGDPFLLITDSSFPPPGTSLDFPISVSSPPPPLSCLGLPALAWETPGDCFTSEFSCRPGGVPQFCRNLNHTFSWTETQDALGRFADKATKCSH